MATCDWPIWVTSKLGDTYQVPCGRCPNCRDNKVDEWVFRLLQQERSTVSAYFITLTYDTESVPLTPNGFMTLYKKDPAPKKYIYLLDDDGNKFRVLNPEHDPSYIKRDIPSFIKRLRNTQEGKISYYACGEYGSLNKRPHYHLIVFGITTQMFDAGEDARGYKKYFSRVVSKCWPFGKIDIGTATGDSAAYCAKYLSKPYRIPEHARDDRVREFSLMSNELGDGYLTPEIMAYHSADLDRNYVTYPDGYKKKLPRYYRERLYNEVERDVQNKRIVRLYNQKFLDCDAALRKSMVMIFLSRSILRIKSVLVCLLIGKI